MLWTVVYLLQRLESALENGATRGVYLDKGVLYPFLQVFMKSEFWEINVTK